MADIRDEIIALTGKVWTWLCLIFLGMVGMFSHNLYIGKKMTFKQALGSFGISFFIGALTSISCYLMDWDRVSMWLVPFATLLADKIMMAVIALNWEQSITATLKAYIKSVVRKWK